jgi:hypothetical protein
MYRDCLKLDGETEVGRILVDVGFTKLWKEWENAGTARYYGNAAVWLLGLDYRLKFNYPVQGKIGAATQQTCRVSTQPLENDIPQVVGSGLDVVFVIDSSGSVGGGWTNMMDFSADVAKKLAISKDSVHLGIVTFNDRSTTQLPLSSNAQSVHTCLANLKKVRPFGGTSFRAGAQSAVNMLRNGRLFSKKLMIFQTDGRNGDYPRYTRDFDNSITVICLGIQGADQQEYEFSFYAALPGCASNCNRIRIVDCEKYLPHRK